MIHTLYFVVKFLDMNTTSRFVAQEHSVIR